MFEEQIIAEDWVFEDAVVMAFGEEQKIQVLITGCSYSVPPLLCMWTYLDEIRSRH